MRKMMFATLVVVLCSLVPSTLKAQEAPTAPRGGRMARRARSPEQRVDRQLQRMTENLNLSEEQREKIRPILVDQAQQLRALRKDTSLSPEDRRAKAGALRRETRQRIDQILTPEQREKRRENRRKARGRGGEQPQPPPNQE